MVKARLQDRGWWWGAVTETKPRVASVQGGPSRACDHRGMFRSLRQTLPSCRGWVRPIQGHGSGPRRLVGGLLFSPPAKLANPSTCEA